MQKEVVMRCRQMGRPVIVASHLLQSMIEYPTPTRAEVGYNLQPSNLSHCSGMLGMVLRRVGSLVNGCGGLLQQLAAGGFIFRHYI